MYVILYHKENSTLSKSNFVLLYSWREEGVYVRACGYCKPPWQKGGNACMYFTIIGDICELKYIFCKLNRQPKTISLLIGCHIECFLNSCLVCAYRYEVFTGRSILAALDHNFHLFRDVQDKYYKLYSKRSGNWRVEPKKKHQRALSTWRFLRLIYWREGQKIKHLSQHQLRLLLQILST